MGKIERVAVVSIFGTLCGSQGDHLESASERNLGEWWRNSRQENQILEHFDGNDVERVGHWVSSECFQIGFADLNA